MESRIDNVMREIEGQKVRFIYTFASTIDKKYKCSIDNISAIADEFTGLAKQISSLKSLGSIGEQRDKTLEKRLEKSIQNLKDGKDSETQIFDEELFRMFEKTLIRYFNDNRIVPDVEESLGSGATYSYSSASRFFENDPNKRTNFLGTMPFTVMKFLLENKGKYTEEFIRGFLEFATPHNEYNSVTLALEVNNGTQKFMISSAKGRSPDDLDLDELAKNVNCVYQDAETDHYVVQMGSLNKGKVELHKHIKTQFEEASKKYNKSTIFYAGTSDFKGDREKIIDVLKVVYSADILSINESELDQIYAALSPDKTNGKPRSQKLKELDSLVETYNKYDTEDPIEMNPNQIKICHSSYGAIAITSYNGEEDRQIIEELLQTCVDGTSMKYETTRYGSLGDIMGYRDARTRHSAELERDFGESLDQMRQDNFAVVPSIKIESAMGSLTGLGAVFDGFASSTMPFYHLKERVTVPIR